MNNVIQLVLRPVGTMSTIPRIRSNWRLGSRNAVLSFSAPVENTGRAQPQLQRAVSATSEHEDRIDRIRNSLHKINGLMVEMRGPK